MAAPDYNPAMPPETCPNCGADVPRHAKACPECGSDEKTGWSEKARYDDLGLPDEEFDYDEYLKEEFEPAERKPRRQSWLWMVVSIIVLMALLYFFWR